MSTLANITSLNLSLQTGGAALAIKAVKSVAKPARTVYVFGTADDVAPNFTTVAGAITYANSLTPIVTEPVVVRLFTKADGTPYDLAGLSSWTTYANSYIYFVSDFVRLNETTTLPTTLPAGQQVWYIDANGVETLWVGREDGSAWPAVGYKEWSALITQSEDDAPTAVVLSNTVGVVTLGRGTLGDYIISNASFTIGKTLIVIGPNNVAEFFPSDGDFFSVLCVSQNGGVGISTLNGDTPYENGGGANILLNSRPLSIRVYP
jgi:hypothetical protein